MILSIFIWLTHWATGRKKTVFLADTAALNQIDTILANGYGDNRGDVVSKAIIFYKYMTDQGCVEASTGNVRFVFPPKLKQ